jgi:transposase-like protein
MKTKTKRKRHSAAFKAKVGLEAVIGIKTVAQIAREYSVHPVQVSQWKGVVRQRLPELFETGSKAADDQEKLVADLHQKIGELTVDLDYLKKKSQPSHRAVGFGQRRSIPAVIGR